MSLSVHAVARGRRAAARVFCAAVAVLAGAGCASPATTTADPPAPAVIPALAPIAEALTAPRGSASAQASLAPSASVTPTVTASASASVPGSASPAAAASAAPSVARTTRASTVAVSAGRIRPGVLYTGPATLYGEGNGAGNCLFDAVADPPVPVVAMNELDYDNARACGAYLQVTGPGGTTVVLVTDRCPECPAGHIDMSRKAFDRVSGGAVGRIDKITWRLASPADIGPIQFKVKKESSQYWLSLQVRNHRNPIASLEVQKNGAWVAIERQMWNFFEMEGLGAGPYTVRITDVYGEQLVSTVNLAPDSVQTTNIQFARH